MFEMNQKKLNKSFIFLTPSFASVLLNTLSHLLPLTNVLYLEGVTCICKKYYISTNWNILKT